MRGTSRARVSRIRMPGDSGLQLGELVAGAIDGVGQPEQQSAALSRGSAPPARGGRGRRRHRPVHVLDAALGDAGDHRVVGGAQHLDLAAGQCRDELVVDEQAGLHGHLEGQSGTKNSL